MPIKAGEQVQGFADRQLLGKPRLLQRDSKQFAQVALMALPRHTENLDLAGSRFQQTFQDLDGSGLSGAIRPQQSEALACLDGEIQPSHRFDLAVVGLFQPSTADRTFHTGNDTEEFLVRFQCSRLQNSFLESRRIVTGPWLTSSTSIVSWKRPVSQRSPRARMCSTKCRYSKLASSGGAAESNEGRFPFLASPCRVNCETANTAPPISATLRFIFPASSSKMRKPAILSAR